MTTAENQPDASKETALTMTTQWTPEAIRALGATTDLPTLGDDLRAGHLAVTRDGENRGMGAGRHPHPQDGRRYRVTVPSILDVLGQGGPPAADASPGQSEHSRAQPSGTAGGAAWQPSEQVAGGRQ